MSKSENQTERYHEIANTRRYLWRCCCCAQGDPGWSSWTDGGEATPETLAAIVGPLDDCDCDYEVREVCDLADDTGQFSQQYRTVYRRIQIKRGSCP